MSASCNLVILCGNLGAEPEFSSPTAATKVATLSVATTKKWTDQNGNKIEKTNWHRVKVFGDGLIDKLIRPHVTKGTNVLIHGELNYSKWTDQDGNERYSTEIVVGRNGVFQICGGKTKDQAPAQQAPTSTQPVSHIPQDDNLDF